MQERKKVRSFEDLFVWQIGIDLVKRIYSLTKEGDFSRDFGLRDQLRRLLFLFLQTSQKVLSFLPVRNIYDI